MFLVHNFLIIAPITTKPLLLSPEQFSSQNYEIQKIVNNRRITVNPNLSSFSLFLVHNFFNIAPITSKPVWLSQE